MKRFGLASILLALALGGCSTAADTFTPSNSDGYIGHAGPNLFGGTRLDVHHFTDPECKTFPMVLFILDTPFSFVFDVLLLPYTLGYALTH